MRFSLSHAVIVVLLIGALMGWGFERRRRNQEIVEHEKRIDEILAPHVKADILHVHLCLDGVVIVSEQSTSMYSKSDAYRVFDISEVTPMSVATCTSLYFDDSHSCTIYKAGQYVPEVSGYISDVRKHPRGAGNRLWYETKTNNGVGGIEYQPIQSRP